MTICPDELTATDVMDWFVLGDSEDKLHEYP
jgi:hypothetical protein